MDRAYLDRRIRKIPNFPKEGILFYDVTTLFEDAPAFKKMIDDLGFKIKELPAKVVDVGRKSKVHPFRDAKNMGLELFRLFKEKKSFKK